MNNKLFKKEIEEQINMYLINKTYDEKTYCKDIINIIKNKFANSIFKPDTNFILNGRKKILKDEFTNNINNNKISSAIENIIEFVTCDNTIYLHDVDNQLDEQKKSWEELLIINNNYNKQGIICLQEKEIIEEMIKNLLIKI